MRQRVWLRLAIVVSSLVIVLVVLHLDSGGEPPGSPEATASLNDLNEVLGGSTDTRPKVQQLPDGGILPEQQEIFRVWNAPYHAKRKAIRKEADQSSAAPFKLHTFYTLDCTHHSLWQVLSLELTWHRVGQGGFISRVISGCDKATKKQSRLSQTVLPQQVEQRQFGAFFTPTFSTLPNGKYYAPYNRPNAIWYWLNHTDLTEDVFALLDPDMIFLDRLYYGDVRRGQPVAQWYNYMQKYKFERFTCPLCPNAAEAYSGGRKFNYEVGPPWMFHIDDLRGVMGTWVALVPMLQEIDPSAWIIEMVAYSVAMAFHRLPHKVIYYGMVDNIMQEPLWNPDHTLRLQVDDSDAKRSLALLHYCYTWEVGEHPPSSQAAGNRQLHRMQLREHERRMPVIDYFHFSKYRVPTDWPGGNGRYGLDMFDCEAPLLQEFHTPNALPGVVNGKNGLWKRTSHFLRALLPVVNEALFIFKRLHGGCAAGNVSGATLPELNARKVIRTSHPQFWVSRYVITRVYPTLDGVDFLDAAGTNQSVFIDLEERH